MSDERARTYHGPIAVTTMPTSGSARRRAKAQRNREAGYWLESLESYRTGRIPRSAVAVSMCSCGRLSWLMPGATDEAREAFDRENEDHDAYCDDGADS